MPGACFTLMLGLALAAGENPFEQWIHAQALRENLTVTTVGTLAGTEGQRLPYARIESPLGPMLVLETAGARWALGPFADRTGLLPDQIGVKVPSKVVRLHELSFELRSGVPVVAREHFLAPTGEW